MGFLSFVTCMFCILSATDIARFLMSDPRANLPVNPSVHAAFYVLILPAAFGVIALPIYGFFVIPWWQVLGGFILAAALTGLFTRRLQSRLYLWAIGYSLISIFIFMITVL